jgi:hypothetical protein
MAEPTTISQVLPAPILEGALTAFTKKLEPLIGQQIDTSLYAPKIAPESVLQADARTAASGLGSLVGPFMSPYQQEVIDTTLSEFDRQAAINRTGMRDRAIQSGAYGGGREGVMAAEFDSRNLMQRAGLQAQLLQQGSKTRSWNLSNTIRSSRPSSTTSSFRCSSGSSKRSTI